MKEKKDKSLWDIHKRNIIIVIFIIILLGIFSYSTSPEKPIREDSFVAFHEDQQKQKGIVSSGYNELLTELEEGVKQGKIKVVNVQFGYNKICYEFSWYNNTRQVSVLKSIAEGYYLPLFNEYKIGLLINDVNQGGGYFGYILWFIILAYFLFFMMRRRQGGGNPLGGLTKSPAKLFKEGTVKITFDNVAGCDEAKEEAKEIIDFLKHPEQFSDIGAKIPKGILLVGPPGTGKTLIAKAIAGEAKVPFFSISGSEFVEMFVGVGAARVRDFFDEAKKNAPAIVFIDEIDAVGRQRGHAGGTGGGHEEREQTLNQILVEMDGFEENCGIVVVAATNRPDILDAALLRAGRFNRHITLNWPDQNGREAILQVHSKKVKLAPDVSLKIVAKRTPGLSGADLENIINEAALITARAKETAVTMKNIEAAIDRVSVGLEQKSRKMTDEEKERVAWHEAGHVLMAELLPHALRSHKVSIIPRGMGLGHTIQLPQTEKYLITDKEMRAKISVLFGGRIAEKIHYGDYSSGAQNDIEKASEIADDFVRQFGMDSKIGPRCLKENTPNFLGLPSMQKSTSEKKAQKIDEAIDKILSQSEEECAILIEKNMELMKKLTQELFEKETLNREDLNQIFAT